MTENTKKVTIYNLFDVDNKPGYTAYTTELDVLLPYSSYQTVTVAIPECLHPEVDEYGRICWAREFYENLNLTNLDDHYDYPLFIYRLRHTACDADGSPLLYVHRYELDLTDTSSAAYIPCKDNDDDGWIPLTIIERGPITPYTPPKKEEPEGEFYFDFFDFKED